MENGREKSWFFSKSGQKWLKNYPRNPDNVSFYQILCLIFEVLSKIVILGVNKLEFLLLSGAFLAEKSCKTVKISNINSFWSDGVQKRYFESQKKCGPEGTERI